MNLRYALHSILLSVLAAFLPLRAKATLAENIFKMKHIGYAEGLSNQRVFSIVEDGNGVIWISTKTGVDRYNGYNLKNYELSDSIQYGDLGGRRIQLLYDERFGLWAYDNTGNIYRYSLENDRFEQALHLKRFTDNGIILNKLYFGPKGVLWLGLNSGLYKYKKEDNGEIVQVLKDHYINDIVATDDALFVGTSKGVLRLLPNDNHLVLTQEQDALTLHYDHTKNEMWVGTNNSGLQIIDLSTQDVHALSGLGPVFLKPIRAITTYDAHSMLIGVDGGGVYSVDRGRKTAQPLMHTEDESPNVLHGNGIYAVTKDSQGNIWTGSYSGGVSAAILLSFPVKTYQHKRGTIQSLANNNVNDIEENADGHLWFATDNGISLLDTQRQRWSHELKGVVVITLSKDTNGSVWASTYGNGIYQLDSHGHVIRHLTRQDGLTTNYVFSIQADPEGDVWVGGLDGDLQLIRKDGHSKCIYKGIKETQTITQIDNNRIAVATTDGFYVVDKRNTTFQHYAATTEWKEREVCTYITAMLFNDDHTVWLGTEGGGLNLYNLQTGEAITYTTHDGLPSNDVYSLQRDNQGRLWASTGKGIAIMDGEHISSLNYVEDVEKVYNKSAFTRLKNGDFVYGSTEGAVLVNPGTIALNDYQAPLRFTRLTTEWLDEEEAEKLPPRLHRMLADGTVRLNYAHNSFTISFETINYRFRHDIAYQYILDGYEKDWNKPTANGEARYTRVSPGSYRFKVRCLRQSDGKVMSEGTLRLEIGQPWWNTWWAWLFYICLMATLFYFILRYKSNRMQKRYDEDKIRFFINTVHNIRTPVTLIMAPLEDLQKEQNLSEDARYFLKSARTNARRLNAQVTQLLEFEKMDAGQKQTEFIPLCLNDILKEEAANFRNYCEKKGLKLALTLPDETVCTMGNMHLIEMLMDNLISNACKYTPSGGRVALRLAANRRKAIIEVEDTGIGIPRKEQKHLFQKVGRLENARKVTEEGTGFGLLQVYRIIQMLNGRISFRSEEGHGTTFTIILQRTDKQPLTVTPNQADTTPEDLTLPSETNDTGKDKAHTLLIVEDHEELRHYLRKTFEHDYRVVDVSDGQKALDCLTDTYPDLILSDVMMPGLSGDELCRRIKSNPDTAGIPVVLLTAKAAHDDVVEGLKTGADDYIPKPFSTEILKLKVQSIIDTRNRLRQYYMNQALENTANHAMAEPQATVPPDEASPTHSEGDQRFILQATRLVTEHIADPDFDINALCREMAMSRTLFYNRLKSLTGYGPQEFIRLIRLNRAAELLKQGSNVNEAAADTGFVNVKYFSSLFKKQYGIQPSKYAAQQ